MKSLHSLTRRRPSLLKVVQFTVAMVIFTSYCSSLWLDTWIIVHKVHSARAQDITVNRTIIFGIFYAYNVNNSDKEARMYKVMELNYFVQYHLQESAQFSPAWVHMTRFVIIMATLSSMYAIITSFGMLVLDTDWSNTQLLMNIVAGCLMLTGMCYILPHGLEGVHLSYGYARSYEICWIVTCMTMTISIFWIIGNNHKLFAKIGFLCCWYSDKNVSNTATKKRSNDQPFTFESEFERSIMFE